MVPVPRDEITRSEGEIRGGVEAVIAVDARRNYYERFFCACRIMRRDPADRWNAAIRLAT